MRTTYPEPRPTSDPVNRSRALPTTPIQRVTPDVFELPANALCRIVPRAGLRIECLQGHLWVTQAGEPRDIVLREGESFTPAAHGRIVAQAFSDSRLRLLGA